jgi:hypothetical protein
MRVPFRSVLWFAAAVALAPHAITLANDVGTWTPEFAFKV